jgi:peptide/nickel transport system substrate-binding protein
MGTMPTERLRRCFFVWAGCLLLTGCGGPPEDKPAAKNGPGAAATSEKSSSDSSAAGADSSTSDKSADQTISVASAPLEREKTAEPFHPPATLAELDAKAEWIDRPVLNSMQLLRDDLAKHPPLVNAQQALAMKNNSPEDNTKILSVLGRLPEPTGEKPNWSAGATRYLIGDINSANPIMIDTVMEFDVVPMSTFGMFTFDWTLIPYAEADTVEKWQTSKDHLCDKITMRRDCTWSDGKPITAHDVEFSYHAIMNQKIPVPAMRTDIEKLSGVVAYDDYTVVIFHKQAVSTGDLHLNFYVIPEHVYGPLYARLDKITFEELLQTPEYQETELNPISGNAFKMVKRVRNQEIVLKRRDDWYMQGGKQVREKPFFDEVRFVVKEDPNTALLALKSGALDYFEIQQQQWATQTNGPDFYEKNTKVYGTEWTYFYFGWNNNEPSAPFFKDRRVREAMSYAFDYRELLDKLLFGLCQQCAGIVHPEAWYAPKTPLKPYVQDLDKAAELLDAAGWTVGSDGTREKTVDGKPVKFEFNMLVKNDPDRIRVCEVMQFNLKQLGIQCNIQPMEATRLFDRFNKKQFQACFAGWGAGIDPEEDENVWATSAIPPAGRNFTQYNNPEVDRLFEEGRKEFDREKRAAIYAKIDEMIYRDQPCTFLYWRSAFFGFNKQLRGYKFSPRGPFSYTPGFNSIWKVAD